MTLRKTTLLIIGATLVGLIGVLYFTTQTILLSSFANLEEQTVNQNVERVVTALDDKLTSLNRTAGDWAPWDDTYFFMEDHNDDFLQVNLPVVTLLNLNLNMMAFIDPAFQFVAGRAIDLQNQTEQEIPQTLLNHLADHPLLLNHAAPEDSLTGLILLPQGPLLLASRPIVTSDYQGPIRGTLVLGRYLDSAQIEELAQATRLSVSIQRLDDSHLPPDFQTALAALTPENPIFVSPLSESQIAGYAMINDVYGHPALLLKVDMPRDIYRQGQASQSYFILSFLVSGLLFGLVMMLLLEKGVLSRLTRLSQSVSSIGASRNLAARVSVKGKDELANLAGEINKMLAALGRSEEALHKAHDELEIRVQQRTAQLSEANQHLQQEIQERLQAEETLRQSEQRFRKIVSSFSDHIYVTEITQERQRINHYLSSQVEKLTGYPSEKFTDRDFWPTTVIHPEDRAMAAAQAARLAEGQDSQLEYRLVRANGEVIWVRDSGRAEIDPTEQSIFIFGLVSDISEHKHAEAALAQARDVALAANRLKSQLLANVSHDLRTPLSAILGYGDMLGEGVYGPLGDKQQNLVQRIISNTHHLTTLVNELLDQAHLEAGTLKLNQQFFNPANLMDQVKSTMNILAEAKGLPLTCEIDPALPTSLWGDPVRLQQIINNLVGNAIKFTEQGSIHLRLYRPDETHWTLQVADTGSGIPLEAQIYIFEPFQQVDGTATRQYKGFGLGLSIVKQLATLMQGQVLLESQPGQGSTFTVILPLIYEPEVIS